MCFGVKVPNNEINRNKVSHLRDVTADKYDLVQRLRLA